MQKDERTFNSSEPLPFCKFNIFYVVPLRSISPNNVSLETPTNVLF